LYTNIFNILSKYWNAYYNRVVFLTKYLGMLPQNMTNILTKYSLSIDDCMKQEHNCLLKYKKHFSTDRLNRY